MSKISLSTAWFKGNYDDMEGFVHDARSWGFSGIELTSALSEGDLQEILKIKETKISSIHSPCSPVCLSQRASPDNPPLSSLDKEERDKAVFYAESTIEFASQVGAEAVVVHCGFVCIDSNGGPGHSSNLKMLRDKLYRLYEQGLWKGREYAQMKEEYQQARESGARKYLGATKRSLDRIVNLASKYKIKLGLETRDSFHEIPQFEEMQNLLEEFGGSPLGYWHDLGHAEKTSRIGFTLHKEWLSHFHDKMIGVHIHDIIGLKDHYVPGTGEMDWESIGQYVAACPIKVCEVGPWNDREKMAEVIPFLKSKGII